MKDEYFQGPSDVSESPPPITARGAFPRWWALAPVLCPKVVVLLFLVFQWSFLLDRFELLQFGRQEFQRDAEALAAIHTARIYWGAALFFATLVSLALLAGAGAVIWRASTGVWWKRGAAIVALGIVGSISWYPGTAMSPWVLDELQLIKDTTGFAAFTQLRLFLTLLFTTAFLQAVAVAMAIDDVVTQPTDIRALVKTHGEVRALLGLTTFWLIIGVLGIGMLHRLTAAAGVPELSAAVESVGAGTTVFAGAFYSALLAATFGPAELLLRRAGARLAVAHSGPGAQNPAKWLEEQGFDLSVSQSLARVVAVFSPLLAGVVQNLASVGG